MTQDLLQREDVATVLDEVTGEGMPQRVGGLPSCEPDRGSHRARRNKLIAG